MRTLRMSFLSTVILALGAGCTAPTIGGEPRSISSNLGSDPSAIPVFNWQDALNVFPATLAAQPSANYNANYCELYVADIGNGNSSEDGATDNWVQVYIQTSSSQSGQILEAGMYTETTDGAQTITLGNIVTADNCTSCYETGYTYTRIEPGTPSATVQQTISQFAFFIDVQNSDGTVVRLWQSNEGSNYSFDQVFAGMPGHVDSQGDTVVSYANPDNYVFWQKDACSN